MTECPKCAEKLGRWKFRIVHDLEQCDWYYKCDCGYESAHYASEKLLESPPPVDDLEGE